MFFQFMKTKFALETVPKLFFSADRIGADAGMDPYVNHGTTENPHRLPSRLGRKRPPFTFNQSANDFKRTLVGTGHGFTATAAIQQRVTASANTRFLPGTMMSGACSSSRRFRRLFGLMTRRYKSFNGSKTTAIQRAPKDANQAAHWQHVRNHPPSSYRNGGRFPTPFKRLAMFLILVSEPVDQAFECGISTFRRYIQGGVRKYCGYLPASILASKSSPYSSSLL